LGSASFKPSKDRYKPNQEIRYQELSPEFQTLKGSLQTALDPGAGDGDLLFQTLKGSLQTRSLPHLNVHVLDVSNPQRIATNNPVTAALITGWHRFKPSKDRYKLLLLLIFVAVAIISFKPSKDRYKQRANGNNKKKSDEFQTLKGSLQTKIDEEQKKEEEKFQTLKGSLQTWTPTVWIRPTFSVSNPQRIATNISPWHWKWLWCLVSNPQRIATNAEMSTAFPIFTKVSNPQRIATNAEMSTAFPIFTKVSNPQRIATNFKPRSFILTTDDVSNPQRIATNSVNPKKG